MRPFNGNELAVLPCGILNLTTGANMHFNVLVDWDSNTSSLTLFRMTEWNGKITYKVVAGFGCEDYLNDTICLMHDQTHVVIGHGRTSWQKVIHTVNTVEGLQLIRKTLKENGARASVSMCVLK